MNPIEKILLSQYPLLTTFPPHFFVMVLSFLVMSLPIYMGCNVDLLVGIFIFFGGMVITSLLGFSEKNTRENARIASEILATPNYTIEVVTPSSTSTKPTKLALTGNIPFSIQLGEAKTSKEIPLKATIPLELVSQINTELLAQCLPSIGTSTLAKTQP